MANPQLKVILEAAKTNKQRGIPTAMESMNGYVYVLSAREDAIFVARYNEPQVGAEMHLKEWAVFGDYRDYFTKDRLKSLITIVENTKPAKRKRRNERSRSNPNTYFGEGYDKWFQ